MKHGRIDSKHVAALALGAVLTAAPAAQSWASFYEVCEVTARVVSLEEIAVFGKREQKLSSESDPTDVKSSSFQTLLELEVLSARPLDSQTDCSELAQHTHRVALRGPQLGVQVGSEVQLTRELTIDLTPDGVLYQMLWSLPQP